MTSEKNPKEEKTTFRLTIESDYPTEKLKQLELNGMRVTKNNPTEKELVFRSQDPLQLILSSKDHKCSKNELVPLLMRNGFEYNDSDFKVFHVHDSDKYYMVLDNSANPAGIIKIGECSLNQEQIVSSNPAVIKEGVSSVELSNSAALTNSDSAFLNSCLDLQVTGMKCKISYYPNYDLAKNYILNINYLDHSLESHMQLIEGTHSVSVNNIEPLEITACQQNYAVRESPLSSWIAELSASSFLAPITAILNYISSPSQEHIVNQLTEHVNFLLKENELLKGKIEYFCDHYLNSSSDLCQDLS